MDTAKIGIIGCGTISTVYFQNAARFSILEVAACADINPARAQAKAAEWNVPRACAPDALLTDPAIDIVVNLTIPQAHFGVCRAALRAGKHVYVEKPLALTLAEGQELAALAQAQGLRLGGAPDTFLGAGAQTCRALIDSGAIGEPVGVSAFMLGRGHESWHPDPEFYYKAGGGPMFDMGPYYLTTLVALLGPLRRVTGTARASFPTRTITSAPKYGEEITVDVPTHIAGLLDFAQGAAGTLTTSFDVAAHALPAIEIYGAEGTLSVPDPNSFGGPVRIKRRNGADWEDVPLARPYADNSRGMGVADLAHAVRSGRAHRASGALALHVLEAMHGFHEASDRNAHYFMQTTAERPAALPLGLAPGLLDD